MRPLRSSESKTIKLDVYMTGEDILVLTKEINLEVRGKKYSNEEVHELITYAKSYIDSSILNENISAKEVVGELNLVSYIPDTDLLVDWYIENYELITSDGKVNNEELDEKTDTWVTAIILYDDIEVEYKIDLTVLPKVFTKDE